MILFLVFVIITIVVVWTFSTMVDLMLRNPDPGKDGTLRAALIIGLGLPLISYIIGLIAGVK